MLFTLFAHPFRGKNFFSFVLCQFQGQDGHMLTSLWLISSSVNEALAHKSSTDSPEMS